MKRPSNKSLMLASTAAEPLEIGNFLNWCDRNNQPASTRINLNLTEAQASAMGVSA